MPWLTSAPAVGTAEGGRTAWRRAGAALAVALTMLVAGCAATPPPPVPPPAPPAVEPVSDAWPRRDVLELALQAYRCGADEGRFSRPMLTVIDYSLPSSEPRLWVIDLRDRRVLHHELVAHGDRSGDTMAVAFSNDIDSHQSSLGLFRTDERYTGAYGYSLRLSGLEPGINDNARARAIVVHGAAYVSRAAVAQWGRIGTTWGCPGLPEDVAPQVIDEIAGGSAVFAYYPDETWLRTSHYLHCGARGAAAAALDRAPVIAAAAADATTPPGR
jgi:hypothetical protein